MKILSIAAVLCCFLMVGIAESQEHWTEGPVWGCGSYRTKDGQFDNYMKYLRSNYLPTTEEGKKQGLILDSKVFVQPPSSPTDWNILICTLYSSYGKARDYNAENDEKWKAIAASHFKTDDEDKQDEMAATRFEMREFLGVSYVREVELRPMK